MSVAIYYVIKPETKTWGNQLRYVIENIRVWVEYRYAKDMLEKRKRETMECRHELTVYSANPRPRMEFLIKQCLAQVVGATMLHISSSIFFSRVSARSARLGGVFCSNIRAHFTASLVFLISVG